MKHKERERIVEELSYESRVGFVAFCVDRCLEEARRHSAASRQLDNLPLLAEGLSMLWARAEEGVEPDPQRIAVIRAHLKTFKQPDPDGENERYTRDVALVMAAGELLGGLLLLEDADAVDAYDVAAALEGPATTASTIYVDWERASDAEVGVIDTALERLKASAGKPFSRDVFANIPEWQRGAVAPEYAGGRITGTDVNRED